MGDKPKHTTEAQHDSNNVENPTADQLRAELDAGRGGDKDAHSDPSAAPLGADAEAGGRPTPAEDIAEARKHEVRRPSSD